MDSSFLVGLNVGLGLYAGILFFKMILQFGLPNHPARVVTYLVSLCVVSFFSLEAALGLSWITPEEWLRWRALPMVAGGLSLLLQIIMMVGQFSLIQQKVFSRIPMIGALLCLTFFPSWATIFLGITLLVGMIFLSVSVGKARYQRRQYFKMSLFILLAKGFFSSEVAGLYYLAPLVLAFAIFYFFLFEQSFAIAAMIDEFQQSLKSESI